ncbi:MAG: peptide ABC transporter substrate-binding protein [Geminicoccaceae bacterium]|nr:peptide ABC transporter substrate-binding protein [Geminicoccaceae bacterium]
MRWAVVIAMVLVPIFSADARDRLVIGITQYPSTLHPNIESMAAKAYVHGLTHRPITRDGADWQPHCYLCVVLPSIEEGTAVVFDKPDGTRDIEITYELHPDAVWGDGVPVTTEDVLFTHEVGSHPLTGVSNAELYRRITAIEVLDAKRFVLTISKLTFDYESIDDFRLLPAHLERAIFEADPATYRNRTLYETDPTNPGLWIGPYLVAETSPGSHLVMRRNPLWWGAPPPFEDIVVRAIENSAALEANLLSGEVDMIEGALGLALDQAIGFEQRFGDRFDVFYKSGLIYEHIDLMLDNPILADRRVRRALIRSIDRQALSDRLFAGRQPVAHSSVNPLDWVYDAQVPTYDFDPDAAAALFDEAGWSTMKNGVRHDASGRPLQLTLMTTAGNRSRELVQQVLQSMWKQAGVDVRIENEPPRVLFGETISRRRFDGMALFAWISAPENVPRSTLRSDEIPTDANGWSGQNYTGFADARMDRLIDAIEIELDRDARKKLWADLQRLYAEELPALPLYFRAEAHIWPHWLENVRPTGHLAPVTLHVEDWKVTD